MNNEDNVLNYSRKTTMCDFSVIITNSFRSECVSVSPLNARGFGCSIPPGVKMNFAFKSEPCSNTISLAIIPITEINSDFHGIAKMKTIGGKASIKNIRSQPCIVEITNEGQNSTTNMTIG